MVFYVIYWASPDGGLDFQIYTNKEEGKAAKKELKEDMKEMGDDVEIYTKIIKDKVLKLSGMDGP